MKSKTKLFIMCGVGAVVLTAVILCFVLIPGSKSPDAPINTTPVETTGTTGKLLIEDPETSIADTESTHTEPITETGEVTVSEEDLPTIPDETMPEPTIPEATIPNDTIPDVTIPVVTIPDETKPAVTDPVTKKETTGTIAVPVTEKIPTDDGNGSTSGGITIGSGQAEQYNCGTPGHHCGGPETHAYVLNLELEGCPYCGKHNCPSFYAVDEWGNTCYTPSKCPSYDVHKDPVYYCQDCGKKCGDGSNGTCVQFVNACSCPNCGVWVEAWTCHTCN